MIDDIPPDEDLEGFLDRLACHGNIRQAARETGMSRGKVNYRRTVNPRFARRWDDALARAKAARRAPRELAVPAVGAPVRDWQDKFFAELAVTSNIKASAMRAGVTENLVHRKRRKDPKFAARWLAALHEGYDLLEMELLGYLRDRQPGWKMEVSGALRALAAHRATVERRRLMTEDEDEKAVLESIDAFLEGMRERRLANEAILLEASMEPPSAHVAG